MRQNRNAELSEDHSRKVAITVQLVAILSRCRPTQKHNLCSNYCIFCCGYSMRFFVDSDNQTSLLAVFVCCGKRNMVERKFPHLVKLLYLELDKHKSKSLAVTSIVINCIAPDSPSVSFPGIYSVFFCLLDSL